MVYILLISLSHHETFLKPRQQNRAPHSLPDLNSVNLLTPNLDSYATPEFFYIPGNRNYCYTPK